MIKKASSSMSGNLIGGWAFLIGVVLAIVLGLFSSTINQTVLFILVVIGLIVGLLNVADREVKPFLMSSAILVIVTSLGQDALSLAGDSLNNILGALLAIFIPATIVVAIKHVFSLAKH